MQHAPYNKASALFDLGFVIGYIEHGIADERIPDPTEGLSGTIFFLYETAFDEFRQQPTRETSQSLLRTLGELKGWLWHVPIANAISDAINRLSLYFANHAISSEEPLTLASREPLAEAISDHQREQLTTAAIVDPEIDAGSAEIATKIGASHKAVSGYWRSLGAIDDEEQTTTQSSSNPDACPSTPTEPDPVDYSHQPNAHSLTTAPSIRYERWKPWEKNILIEMRDAGRSWDDIVAVIGHTIRKCRAMYRSEKQKREAASKTPAPTESPPQSTVPESDPVQRFLDNGGTIRKVDPGYAFGYSPMLRLQ